MWLPLILLAVVTLLLYKLFFSGGKVKAEKEFLRRHEVPEVDTSKAITPLGVFIFGKNINVGDKICYAEMTRRGDKFCWTTELGTPRVVLRDVEVIKKVMIKDFDHFVDRRKFFNDDNSPFRFTLPMLEGDEWKGVRSAVSPTFTTGKIRRMMDYFNSVGNDWVAMLRQKCAGQGSCTIAVESTTNQYTIDVIASAVFGLKTGTIQDDHSAFTKMAEKVVEMGWWKLVKFTLNMFFPTIFKMLNVSLIDPKALSFFEKILHAGLEERMKGTGPKRNDFIQMLVEAKIGDVKTEGSDELSSFEKDAQIKTISSAKKQTSQYLTDDIMNGQCLVFFVAGFSTTSSFISFLMYALAVYPEVQEKLRQEIDPIFKEDGTVSYDDLGKLAYLEMVCNETLRKFPAVERVERVCVRDYQDPETGLAVKKGTIVGLPISQLHGDVKYYDRPDDFFPEHFTAERKAARSPYAFAPFGVGPRNCIGKLTHQRNICCCILILAMTPLIASSPSLDFV